MPIFLQRFLLRNDYLFDSIIEEVAKDMAMAIRAEPATEPYHLARLAMANKVLGPADDEIRARFFRELKDRAVRTQAFLTEAFKSGKTTTEGVPIPNAGLIPDTMLFDGIKAVWNDVTLLAWPTVVEDTTPASPPAEPTP